MNDNDWKITYPGSYNVPPQEKRETDGHWINEIARDNFLDSDEVSEALALWFDHGGDESFLDRLKYIKLLEFEKADKELAEAIAEGDK